MSLFDKDIDALHVMPLSIVPLTTASLQKARIIKNSRLEGVVELFSDDSTGSGQINPEQLRDTFDFADSSNDPIIVEKLCKLPSYDVYSLRASLRENGIRVEDNKVFRLTPEAQGLLSPYLHDFTRPLVQAVYGNDATGRTELNDLLALFTNPDTRQARNNLVGIADKLRIDLPELPSFLVEYGDVYLSLAYYQSNLEAIRQDFALFLKDTQQLRSRARRSGGSTSFVQALDLVGKTLRMHYAQIDGAMDDFRSRTGSMWEDISAEQFHQMKELVRSHQSAIGGALCALTVKLNAWSRRFPRQAVGAPADRMNFVVSEMLPGIDKITKTSFSVPDADPMDVDAFYV